MVASLVTPPKIASFTTGPDLIGYEYPIAVATQDDREIFEIKSTFKQERITGNHNLVRKNGYLQKLETFDKLSGNDMLLSLTVESEDTLDLNPDLVRMCVWMMTHGSIMRDEEDYWFLFNKPTKRISRRVKAIVQRIPGLKWEDVGPSLEVHGEYVRQLVELLTGQEEVNNATRWFEAPDWFDRLPTSAGAVVAEELSHASTQGFMSSRNSYFNGWSHNVGESLQWFLITRGIPATLNKLRWVSTS
ncbi:hypothetical protein [Xanthomonas phage JGB6]|nr:hypothetical protein [Xanthomonas phage JGB6]